MKVLIFGFITNSGVALWLSWLSWLEYRQGHMVNVILFMGLIALNLGVLAIQWATFKINQANNKMLAEQKGVLDAMMACVAEVDACKEAYDSQQAGE